MAALAQIAQEKEAIAQQLRAEKQSRSKQRLERNSHNVPFYLLQSAYKQANQDRRLSLTSTHHSLRGPAARF